MINLSFCLFLFVFHLVPCTPSMSHGPRRGLRPVVIWKIASFRFGRAPSSAELPVTVRYTPLAKELTPGRTQGSRPGGGAGISGEVGVVGQTHGPVQLWCFFLLRLPFLEGSHVFIKFRTSQNNYCGRGKKKPKSNTCRHDLILTYLKCW